jgi:hypothetical protein
MEPITGKEYLERLKMAARAERRAARENDAAHPIAPLCLNCSKPLKRYAARVQNPGKQWGARGDGLFCNLYCGYYWAKARAAKMS